MDIILNDIEEKIFGILLDFIKNNNLIILRVAGGWVRDKILNKNSNDIDIVIEGIEVEEFLNLLKKYLDSNYIKCSNYKILLPNPDKSKNLKTGIIRILNCSIDFVNIRNKSNVDNNIKDDALLRDFTINSLYYNINTKCIEDYTGIGLKHLKEDYIIDTPLYSEITFMDDPLRILRSFRFMCQLNYNLSDNIITSLSNKVIINNLKYNISKERIASEINKSILSKYNYKLFEIILAYRLLFVLYNDDIIANNSDIIENNLLNIISYLKNNNIAINDNDYNITLIFCILYKDLYYKNDIFLKNDLLLTNKILNNIDIIFRNVNILNKITNNMINNLGIILKEIGIFLEISFLLCNNSYIETYIKQNNLQDFYLEKNIINGNEVKEYLNIDKKNIKTVINESITYQFINYPRKIEQKEFINYYKNKFN